VKKKTRATPKQPTARAKQAASVAKRRGRGTARAKKAASVPTERIAGQPFLEIDRGRWDVPALRAMLKKPPLDEALAPRIEMTRIGDDERRWAVSAHRVLVPADEERIVVTVEDASGSPAASPSGGPREP
jgi:hypothetical protein